MACSEHSIEPSAPKSGLAELVDERMLKSILDDFYQLTSIPMSLIDLDGTVVVGAGWQEACVRFHRANPETCAHCVSSDTVLTSEIEPGEARLYKCENGMWDAATPITVGGVKVGNLFTGQFFFDDEVVDTDFFRSQANRYGFDESAYLAAIDAVPRLSRDAVDVGLRFLTKLSSLISQLSFSNQELERTEAVLHESLSRQIALSEQLGAERRVLDAVMENTGTHLAYLDPEFKFVAVNSAYAEGSGHPKAELIGKNHFELFPNEENQAIFERARAEHAPVEFSAKPFEFPDQPWRGTTYWDWSLTPVDGPDGSLHGFAFSLQNVTRSIRQKAFSDTINRLDEVIHATLDVEWILERAVPELARATRAEVVAVLLRSGEKQWKVGGSSGLPDEFSGAVLSDNDLPKLTGGVRADKPVIIRSGTVQESSMGLGERLSLRAALVTPLSVSGELLGVVVYAHSSPEAEFDEFLVDFATKTASSLSLAINNSRLFHEARHSAVLSNTLATVNEILLETVTVDDVLQRLVGDVSQSAAADMALVAQLSGGTITITNACGFGEEWIGASRPAAFFATFAHALELGSPVLVNDAWNDERTNKEFVVPAGIRAMQVLPLAIKGRLTHVYALCNADPRAFDEHDLESAQRMAAGMSAALENARLYEAEHRVADRLQEALLALPSAIPGVSFAHVYQSASEASRVGGDFYDIFELDDRRVGITIGDVAGKGLDAAVLTSLVKNTIRAHASERGKSAGQVLALTNNVIYRSTEPESFVTLLFGVLDRQTGRFIYASAGHPAAAIVRPLGEPAELPGTGPVLGAFGHVAYQEAEVALEVGDVLFLYTDGLTEARRGDEFYGDARFAECLAMAENDAAKLVEYVRSDALEFAGGRLTDDLAMLAVKRTLS